MGKKSYEEIINAIVSQTNQIIGPVAIMQANNVKGLKVTAVGKVSIKGDPVKKIKQLVKAYEVIIGPVAVTLAKKGIEPVLKKNPKLKIPMELK